MSAEPSGDQLLRIARDPELRSRVYDHLREYCHQCRNRLNSLKLSIYLAMKQSSRETADVWSEIDHQYRELECRVELVQFLCRPLTLSRVILGIELLMDDRAERWRHRMASGGKRLELIPPVERAVASFDVDGLGRALDALVSWRAGQGSGSSSASLSWWVEEGEAHIRWAESPPEDSAIVPAPDAPPGSDSRQWALPLVARVILAFGGDYRVRTDPGWQLDAFWPSRSITP